MNTVKEKIIPAHIDYYSDTAEYLEELLESAGCPPKTMIEITIAFEEIFVNIASYAYPNENADKKGMVKMIFTISDDEKSCAIKFIDQGIPYDPLAKPDPDVTLSIEEREVGGLGIYMVKQSMDSVAYEYKDGSNVFTIYKKF